MKRSLCLTVLCFYIALTAHAQGIRFQTKKNWDQILSEAKAAHKYIFVNCYMEGGLPCIEMDRNVFPVKRVGDFYNKNFIAVSIDMERTVTDEASKAVKAEADAFKKKYKVNGYPNLLFMDSEGKLLHRFIGSQSPDEFIKIGKDALRPETQFYTQLEAFKAGKYVLSTMPGMAFSAFDFGESAIAVDIAKTYLQNKQESDLLNKVDISLIGGIIKDQERASKLAKQYAATFTNAEKARPENIAFLLNSAGEQDTAVKYVELFLKNTADSILLKRANVNMIARFAFIQGPGSNSFRFLYKNRHEVDKSLKKTNALDQMFDKLITRDEINPVMVPASKTAIDHPDWDKLQSSIAVKFNAADAERNVLQAKLRWYEFKKNWLDYNAALVQLDQKYGSEWPANDVNGKLGWPLFLHSNKPEELNYAISRMYKLVIQPAATAGQLDTYANLLYKAGQKEEAIKWQKKAIEQNPEDKKMQITLEKMNNGTSTWMD